MTEPTGDPIADELNATYGPKTALTYEREGAAVRLTLTAMTNHELRDMLTGLIFFMEADDVADYVVELIAYAAGDYRLPIIAANIATGRKNGVDLLALRERGENVRQ